MSVQMTTCDCGKQFVPGGEARREAAELLRRCSACRAETIAMAAVRTKSRFNDRVLVWTVSRPGRHSDMMTVGDREAEERMEQGFVTSTGRFVDRHEAFRIAKAAGQLLARAQGGPSLFSEDVW